MLYARRDEWFVGRRRFAGISFGDCHVSGAFSKPHQGHALTAESRGLVEKHAFGGSFHEGVPKRGNRLLQPRRPALALAERVKPLPRLFWIVAHDTLGFLEESWFGDQDERITATLAKIIYSKTLKWKDECEYRLAIPLGEDEEPYDTLPYYPEEIMEMYLGLAMTETDKADITAKARAVNPDITIFQAKRDADNAIVFDRL